MATTMELVIPAVVIVDTQNVRGQAKDNLGAPRDPRTQGLDDAMQRLGFEVTQCFFSVSLPREADARRLSRQAKRTTDYMAILSKDPRVRFLEGELHSYGGKPVEKLVDVQCAIETVRQAKRIADGPDPSARAVIVLSQDIDLGPGVDLALEFGVPIYVAAAGSVHKRSHPYMLLDELALADLVQSQKPYGSSLRRAIAEAAANPKASEWEYQYQAIGQDGTSIGVLSDPRGFLGTIDYAVVDGMVPGESATLAVMGIVHDLPNHFPQLQLGHTPNLGDDLIDGSVRYSPFPLNSIITLDDGREARLYRGNLNLAPETPVLVQDRGKGQFALIGATGDSPLLEACGGMKLTPQTVIATVRKHKGPGAIAETHDGVGIYIPGGASRTEVGNAHLVSLVAGGKQRNSMFTGLVVSTSLPSK